jgi:hypothetical protein
LSRDPYSAHSKWDRSPRAETTKAAPGAEIGAAFAFERDCASFPHRIASFLDRNDVRERLLIRQVGVAYRNLTLIKALRNLRTLRCYEYD